MSLHSPFPPLPQPDGYAAMTSDGTIIVPPSEYAKHNAYAVFTADQMRDYALAAITSQHSVAQPQAPQGAVKPCGCKSDWSNPERPLIQVCGVCLGPVQMVAPKTPEVRE